MSDLSRPVRMCACAKVTFQELLDQGVSTMAEAETRFSCGITCGLCRPYLQRMLETGETEFDVIDVSAN